MPPDAPIGQKVTVAVVPRTDPLTTDPDTGPLTVSPPAVVTNPPELSVTVDGHTFQQPDGFPTVGFESAHFLITVRGLSPDEYTWTTSAPAWTTVRDGEVTFTAKGNNGPVSVTATPKTPGHAPLTYKFKLDRWFYVDLQPGPTYNAQVNSCEQGTHRVRGHDVSHEYTLAGYSTHGALKPLTPTRTTAYPALFNQWGSETVDDALTRPAHNRAYYIVHDTAPDNIVGGGDGLTALTFAASVDGTGGSTFFQGWPFYERDDHPEDRDETITPVV